MKSSGGKKNTGSPSDMKSEQKYNFGMKKNQKKYQESRCRFKYGPGIPNHIRFSVCINRSVWHVMTSGAVKMIEKNNLIQSRNKCWAP